MLRAFTILFLLLASFGAMAADGAVVTVTGKVENPNRGAFDEKADGFFAYHNVSFEKARTFTFAELTALGMQEITLHYPNWPAAMAFRGPRLLDVLAAAGWSGDKVLVQALDGYAFELDRASIEAGNFILALEADGQPLALGGKGPAWLVFPLGSYPEQPSDSDAGLVWAVFHIAVQ